MRFNAHCRNVLLVALCALLCMQCKTRKESPEEPEDFMSFYERFHTDSLFQMSRIVFPLSGIPAKDTADAFSWTAQTWTLHRPFNNSSGEFEQDIQMITDDLAVETISVRGMDIAMERRFARLADGWNLIFYVEMQPVAFKNR